MAISFNVFLTHGTRRVKNMGNPNQKKNTYLSAESNPPLYLPATPGVDFDPWDFGHHNPAPRSTTVAVVAFCFV